MPTNRSLPSRRNIVVTGLVIGLQLNTRSVWADTSANPLVIRYLDDSGYVPSYEIADALGFFNGTGIRLEAEGDSPGGPESLAALAAGKIDVAGAATPAMINAIAVGAKILCVMPRAGVSRDVNSKFFVLDGSPIKVAADLKGKSIAVNTLGAHLDYTVREYLRLHGLKKEDVKLVTVPGPKLDETLRQGQSDVVAVGAWQGQDRCRGWRARAVHGS